MMQLRLQVGWKLAVLVVASTFSTGCTGTVDSGDYEAIDDQAEAATHASVLKQDSVDGGNAAGTASDSKSNADSLPAEIALPEPGESEQSNHATSEDNAEAIAAVDIEKTTASKTPAKGEPAGSSAKPAAKDPAATADSKPPTEGVGTSKKESPAEPDKNRPRIVTLLIPEKTFAVEGPEKALRVSFDDFDLLKVLNMDPVTQDAPARMPKWLKQLDGKRIRVRGFMYPPFEETGIRGFTLARDNQICCFGRNPLVYDLVDIFMRKGESTDYIQNRPFDVVGVFHIGDSIIPGELYSMDDAIVVD